MPRDADELLALLDLEKIDDDLFRGAQMPTRRPMVFGGQVAAQSLVAASRTVARRVRRPLAALLLPAAGRPERPRRSTTSRTSATGGRSSPGG